VCSHNLPEEANTKITQNHPGERTANWKILQFQVYSKKQVSGKNTNNPQMISNTLSQESEATRL